MDDSVRQEIEALRSLKVKALQQRYRDLFGEDSPSSNRMHLFRRIAWQLQARHQGGLSEAARRRATELADPHHARLRAPRSFWNELQQTPRTSGRDPRLPVAGTVLTRSYRGQQIQVTVREDGFEFEGKPYPSLSTIACQITGTRWNGFAFFKLNPGGQP